jgi:carboxyl-terminal processing protease
MIRFRDRQKKKPPINPKKIYRMHHIKSLFATILVLTGTFFAIVTMGQSVDDKTFELLKNLDIYADVIKELNNEYVDEIQPGELIKTGIDAMLQSLDPYTNYIPETDVEDYQFMTTGQYGGIGALIHQRKNYVVISEPYEGFPAERAGLLAGDIIMEVNGKPTDGKHYDEVSAVLKGQAGSTIHLKIKREGVDGLIEKTLVRETIRIPNIPYSGIVGGDIGYIKLSGFTQNAGMEVKQEFLKLKEQQPLKGVIIDLRSNGGGLLHEAVKLSNIFVEKNKEIVTTKGKLKEQNRIHRTSAPPIDLKIPLVVLVDNQSASASEIFAGAMQDLDRGVVVGQRTFGKGLVQNVIPLSYKSQLKVTVAKYYIPSGRCIQAIDYSHKDTNGYYTTIPDSLLREFSTENGRKVFEGGGITPDVSVDPRSFSQIAMTLFTRFLIFDYATKYYREHPEIDDADQFVVNDTVFDDFLQFIEGKNYTYTTRSERMLELLKKEAKEEGYYDAIAETFEKLHQHMMEDKKADIHTYKDEIKELLKLEIVSRYYHQRGKVEASLSNDPELKEAIQILHNPKLYESILETGKIIDEG